VTRDFGTIRKQGGGFKLLLFFSLQFLALSRRTDLTRDLPVTSDS
jgi:hypothetical protein